MATPHDSAIDVADSNEVLHSIRPACKPPLQLHRHQHDRLRVNHSYFY